MNISIDRTRCSGYGLCAELLPELIRLDDWGYPIVGPGLVPDRLGGHARRAVAACPALALRLRASGSQQTPSFASGSSQPASR